MSTISGKEVWAQVIAQNKYSSPIIIKVSQPFVELLPDILNGMLDEKVTIITLLKAKLAYWRFCAETGYGADLVTAMYPEAASQIDLNTAQQNARIEIQKLVDEIEKLSQGKAGVFYANYLTDTLLYTDLIGLNDEVLRLLIVGKLTIGLLLKLQPSVIFDIKVVNALS